MPCRTLTPRQKGELPEQYEERRRLHLENVARDVEALQKAREKIKARFGT